MPVLPVVVALLVGVLVGLAIGHTAGSALARRAGPADVGVVSARLGSVNQELARLGELVHLLQRDTARRGGATEVALRQVVETQASLAEYTQDLRVALGSPKQRGQWGERMAEDVLRAAGFREGVNYRRQRSIAGGSVPDIAFLLPNDLEVRMDVKFPVDNHLRSLQATSADDAERYTKLFVRDVRGRIRELAGRGYAGSADTVGVTLLFIPNEAVYAALHDADPDVIDVALAEHVVLCSPSTLFAVLAVIRHAVEQFRLARVGDEIIECLGTVSDQWGRFCEQLDVVERRLAAVTNGFDDLQGVRRRQIERAFGEVDRLRAPPDETDGCRPRAVS